MLACVNENTKLPDDKKCPAFALLVRTRPAQASLSISSDNSPTSYNICDCHKSKHKHKQITREALLVIRGSKSVMDWSINLNEAATPYTYMQGGFAGAKAEEVSGFG